MSSFVSLATGFLMSVSGLPDALELGIVGEISIVLDTTFIIGFDLAITLSSSPAPS